MRLTFSETDEHRIAEAITNAERKTSGEIVAVVSAESSTYLYAPFLWASVAALLDAVAAHPLDVVAGIVGLSRAGRRVSPTVLLLTLPRPIRYRLVPARVKRARAHRRAMEQFVAQNLHTTGGRTGVLIFVSVAERHAEIVADTAIHDRVPKGTWESHRRAPDDGLREPAARGGFRGRHRRTSATIWLPISRQAAAMPTNCRTTSSCSTGFDREAGEGAFLTQRDDDLAGGFAAIDDPDRFADLGQRIRRLNARGELPSDTQRSTSIMLARWPAGSRLTASPQNTPMASAPFNMSRLSGSFGMSPAAKPTTRKRPCHASARTAGSAYLPPTQS